LQAVIDHDNKPRAMDMPDVKAILADTDCPGSLMPVVTTPVVTTPVVNRRSNPMMACHRLRARQRTGSHPSRRAGHNPAQRMQTHRAAILLFPDAKPGTRPVHDKGSAEGHGKLQDRGPGTGAETFHTPAGPLLKPLLNQREHRAGEL